MLVRFWGTRGSIATPGGATLRYGGNTSCVEVMSDSGTTLIIDAGTGANALGKALTEQGRAAHGHILISHTHWDHIQGLPFFAPLFVADAEWHIYGPRGIGQTLQDVLAAQMDYAYFPVALNAFAARLHYHEVVEGRFSVEDVWITTHYLNHPALTVGYRLEADGASMVYASDHEPHNRRAGEGHLEPSESGDTAHVEFIRDADLVIHDAQYTAAEFPAKIGWGHSTIEYAVDVAMAANVKQLALYHHDPNRGDDAVDQLISNARERVAAAGNDLSVVGAAEGSVIELRHAAVAIKTTPFLPSSLVKPASSVSEELVFIAGVPAKDRAILTAAAQADGIPSLSEVTIEQLKEAVQRGHPSLIFLGDALSDPVALCAEIRALPGEDAKETQIIIVANQSQVPADKSEPAGVTDWLTRPYSLQYARSRMRAWLMRSMLRWRKAALPRDEEERLAAVYRLGLLDTDAEERFDRHARIAAAAFDAPIALVTLIDRERQWYKAHYGFDFSETSRDMGFCSHAILQNEPLVVNDALRDDRFADNPVVIGDPHVRFYAGIPLHAADGARVGAFCIVDSKPRSLSAAQLRLLKDIARLIEEELQPRAPAKAGNGVSPT
ncbi:MAG TPA: GAF domain-containing protein [Candidatus Limnocylindrales bacterium]|nr:GAF domain-containing protein [Candidatus Limnocylindrales bacterium]